MTGATDVTDATKLGLLDALTGFVGYRPPEQLEMFRASVRRLLDDVGGAELTRVLAHVAGDGPEAEQQYCPAERFARDVLYAMADVTLMEGSGLVGGEKLAAVRDRALILMPNHVSYSDANLLEIILHRGGFADLADRLTVITGPKVYSDTMRRFSSLCFGTIKTAQSSSLSPGGSTIRARDIARIARQTISLSFERMDVGDALVLFAEGTRSRSANMQAILPAISRYLEHPGSVLVPLGITGTERLHPIGDNQLQAAKVVIQVGDPIECSTIMKNCGNKRPAIAAALGEMIAQTLPASYRGIYT